MSTLDGKEIGVVASGTKTPTVNKALGMAFVETPYAALDTKLTFVVRGRNIPGHVVQLPFYKRSK